MASLRCKKNLENAACFELNCKENAIPIKLFKSTFPHFGFCRLHRYAKNRTQTQPSFLAASPRFCLPCSEVIHENFKEVFIET